MRKILTVPIVRYAISITISSILFLTTFFTFHHVSAGQLVAPIYSSSPLPHVIPSNLLPTTPIQKLDISETSWDPSSPDPAGIAYWPSRNTLLVADSEVDEMPQYFSGDNVFEASLTGDLLSTCSTTNIQRRGWTNEPTGVAINPNNNHIFFSDDSGGGKLHEVRLGADGIYCTADDHVTTVRAPGSGDAEGIAYGENKIFIAGGKDKKVYIIDLGPNGVLGGWDDGEVSSFDTGSLGFYDIEGIEYNPDNGTLFIVSTARNDHYIGEVSLSGKLINAYSLDYLGKIPRSGLAYGPSSWNPGIKSIYLISSGVDNRRDHDENDGEIWEIHLGKLPRSEEATSVVAITRKDLDPTSASSVQFTVDFSNPVEGVSQADFYLSISDGIEFAAITAVTGANSTYTVTVYTGTGNGTIRLDFMDRDNILDRDGRPLGGPGPGNGSYEAGEMYTIQKGSIQVEPISLDFENNFIRTWANLQMVTVRNTGTGPVQLGKLGISDSEMARQTMFLVDNHCDEVLLAVGETCSFGTAFRPVRLGEVNGQVTIPSDILEQSNAIDLTGRGVRRLATASDFAFTTGVDHNPLLTVWAFTNVPKGLVGLIYFSQSVGKDR